MKWLLFLILTGDIINIYNNVDITSENPTRFGRVETLILCLIAIDMYCRYNNVNIDIVLIELLLNCLSSRDDGGVFDLDDLEWPPEPAPQDRPED